MSAYEREYFDSLDREIARDTQGFDGSTIRVAKQYDSFDALNRMTSATVSQNAPAKSFAYDAIGNLLSKSDVGAYTYPLAGSARPHAVTSISSGNINTTFTYDPNGNQTSGLGRSISYTSYNKPSSITQGSGTLNFSHDVDHQRFKQVAPEGITRYFDAFGVHAELFLSSNSQWYDFIGVGGSMLGVCVLGSDNSVTTRYFHTDNLGSIAVITNESGAVVERDSGACPPAGEARPEERLGQAALPERAGRPGRRRVLSSRNSATPAWCASLGCNAIITGAVK